MSGESAHDGNWQFACKIPEAFDHWFEVPDWQPQIENLRSKFIASGGKKETLTLEIDSERSRDGDYIEDHPSKEGIIVKTIFMVLETELSLCGPAGFAKYPQKRRLLNTIRGRAEYTRYSDGRMIRQCIRKFGAEGQQKYRRVEGQPLQRICESP